MPVQGASVDINQPVDVVFRYLVELNDAHWRSSVVEMRLLSESFHGVGSRHVEVRRVPGRAVNTVAEVTAYEPNRRWVVRRATGPVRPEVTYDLEPTPTGTRLLFTFDLPVVVGIAKILRPLVPALRRIVHRAFRADLNRLKQQIETQGRTG